VALRLVRSRDPGESGSPAPGQGLRTAGRRAGLPLGPEASPGPDGPPHLLRVPAAAAATLGFGGRPALRPGGRAFVVACRSSRRAGLPAVHGVPRSPARGGAGPGCRGVPAPTPVARFGGLPGGPGHQSPRSGARGGNTAAVALGGGGTA